MPTMTLKNIPGPIHQKLKQRAQSHHRSLNREILACLESVVESVPLDVNLVLKRARSLRSQISTYLTDRKLSVLKREGRP